MSDCVRDIMTSSPVTLRHTSSVLDAARAMADANVGPVLVVDSDGALRGVLTDRDIVVRVVATARHVATPLSEVCTEEPATLSPADSVATAVRLMREQALRRLPVVASGKPVGIVSLGDLMLKADAAVGREIPPALVGISAAPSDDPPTEAHPKVSVALSALSPPWDVPEMPPASSLDEKAGLPQREV